ncbi:hypothetical protein B0H11DRAFT_2043119 [Mycena galericulata]|nr:hypothetical protein B0H11DRAFT_2043119 [Mycena galericulata]
MTRNTRRVVRPRRIACRGTDAHSRSFAIPLLPACRGPGALCMGSLPTSSTLRPPKPACPSAHSASIAWIPMSATTFADGRHSPIQLHVVHPLRTKIATPVRRMTAIPRGPIRARRHLRAVEIPGPAGARIPVRRQDTRRCATPRYTRGDKRQTTSPPQISLRRGLPLRADIHPYTTPPTAPRLPIPRTLPVDLRRHLVPTRVRMSPRRGRTRTRGLLCHSPRSRVPGAGARRAQRETLEIVDQGGPSAYFGEEECISHVARRTSLAVISGARGESTTSKSRDGGSVGMRWRRTRIARPSPLAAISGAGSRSRGRRCAAKDDACGGGWGCATRCPPPSSRNSAGSNAGERSRRARDKMAARDGGRNAMCGVRVMCGEGMAWDTMEGKRSGDRNMHPRPRGARSLNPRARHLFPSPASASCIPFPPRPITPRFAARNRSPRAPYIPTSPPALWGDCGKMVCGGRWAAVRFFSSSPPPAHRALRIPRIASPALGSDVGEGAGRRAMEGGVRVRVRGTVGGEGRDGGERIRVCGGFEGRARE